jgi:hypothetical protein
MSPHLIPLPLTLPGSLSLLAPPPCPPAPSQVRARVPLRSKLGGLSTLTHPLHCPCPPYPSCSLPLFNPHSPCCSPPLPSHPLTPPSQVRAKVPLKSKLGGLSTPPPHSPLLPLFTPTHHLPPPLPPSHRCVPRFPSSQSWGACPPYRQLCATTHSAMHDRQRHCTRGAHFAANMHFHVSTSRKMGVHSSLNICTFELQKPARLDLSPRVSPKRGFCISTGCGCA